MIQTMVVAPDTESCGNVDWIHSVIKAKVLDIKGKVHPEIKLVLTKTEK